MSQANSRTSQTNGNGGDGMVTTGICCYCCYLVFMKTDSFPLIMNVMHAKHEVLIFHWFEIMAYIPKV